jgi:uncharacterized cupin superfamily protein
MDDPGSKDGAPAMVELFPARPLATKSDVHGGRHIVGDDSGTWELPVLAEWELRAGEWIDQHPHAEFNYILEGELHVEVDGHTVVGGTGSVIWVHAGSRGRYFAPVYARMLSIYGPNPTGAASTTTGPRALFP